MSHGDSPMVVFTTRLATPDGAVEPGHVVLAGGQIAEVSPGVPRGGRGVVDLGDRTLAPGFLDLHVHGAAGAEVGSDEEEAAALSLEVLAAWHARHGTTALLATTVADSPERLAGVVRAVARAGARSPGGGAQVLGCHLEGPFLAVGRAGAHSPAALMAPSVAALEEIAPTGQRTVRMITLAPELPGALEVIRSAAGRGIVVAIGHSDATFEEAEAAFSAGARHATHLFNAMAPLHHRRPGPALAALLDEAVSVEIIADGVHLHDAVLRLVARLAPGRVTLVTDAVGAAGLGSRSHRVGGLEVEVASGRVSLASRPDVLAGSLLSMDAAVAHMVSVGAMSFPEALAAASRVPADVLGETRKGRIAPGADADLVVLGADLRALATVVAGRVVHDPGHLFAPSGRG